MKRIRFTQEGFDSLKAKHEELLSQREGAVQELKRARELGDLSENGLYKAARARLTSIDSRLRRFSLEMKLAEVVKNADKSRVLIGNKAFLSDGKKEFEYFIVGDLEADPKAGKISLLSPIGKALEGRRLGETVEVTTPSGKTTYKITKIS